MRTPTTRRDERVLLQPGSSIVRFADPREGGKITIGRLTTVSASGLAFVVEGEATQFPTTTLVDSITLRIGTCMITGEVVVRNTRRAGKGKVEVGCLFYPAVDDEERWMTLLAGIDFGLKLAKESAA